MNRAERRRANKLCEPTHAEMEALLKTDVCTVCSRPFEHFEATTVGYINGRLHLAGKCCSEQVTKVVGGTLYTKECGGGGSFGFGRNGLPVNTHQVKTDDREWFAAHPTRSHRIRPATPEERDAGSWVAVRQFEPGVRQRLHFDFPLELIRPPDDEADAHALFDVVYEARERGASFIHIDDLIRRLEMMSQGGRA